MVEDPVVKSQHYEMEEQVVTIVHKYLLISIQFMEKDMYQLTVETMDLIQSLNNFKEINQISRKFSSYLRCVTSLQRIQMIS